MYFKSLHPPWSLYGGQLNFTKPFEQFIKPRTASNHQEEESVYITDQVDLTQNKCWQAIIISIW